MKKDEAFKNRVINKESSHTINNLEKTRLISSIGGVSLIGADILAGSALNGIWCIGVGGLAFSLRSDTLLRRERKAE